MEKAIEVLKSDISKLKKCYGDSFRYISSKSDKLTKQKGLLDWYVSWDHLGIMADLSLRGANRGKESDLGLDKLKDDSLRLGKINETMLKELGLNKSHFIKEQKKSEEVASEKSSTEDDSNK